MPMPAKKVLNLFAMVVGSVVITLSIKNTSEILWLLRVRFKMCLIVPHVFFTSFLYFSNCF